MQLDLQYDILNDTPANASPVEANFNRLEQHINAEVINRDGTVAMTAPLLLPGNPTNPFEAATKSYVDTFLPVGLIMLYAGGAVPPGGSWLLCNGASVPQASYPQLFALIGTAYGGSGSNFNLPSLAGRFPMMPAAGVAVGVTGGTADAVVVSHAHGINHDHGPVSSTPAGGTHAHSVDAHSHDMTHVHSGGTAAAGDHFHSITVRHDPVSGSAGSIAVSNAGGTLSTRNSNNAGTHSHGVTVDYFYGSTAQSGAGVTSNVDTTHNHTVTVSGFTGNSATAGVDGVGQNLPPYITVNYIIRAA